MNGLRLVLIWAVFMGGVVVESVFDLTLLAVQVLAITSLLSAIYWRRLASGIALTLSLICLVTLLGVVRTQWYESQFIDSSLASEVGEQVEVVGMVITEPDERANFTQLYVQTASDKILVRADRFTSISYGDEVQVIGKLTIPEVFVTDTDREFNYPKYLELRGVQNVISFAELSIISSNNGNLLLASLYKLKQHFVSTLEQVISSPQVDLGVGLLLGVKQALGKEVETAFRQTGIIHIVVLSGYNIMLVVGFFWWLSSWVLPLRGRIVFGLIAITLFALLVGLSATVVRASIMAAILLIGKLIGRTYDVLRALLFAAFIMVFVNPYILLYDIGFQLSFMATLGLVLVLPQFESTLATKSSTLKLKDLFIATVVTQIFVLPLLMYHIGEVSLVSVIVNMLVLPMVPVAMMVTFVTGLVGLVSIKLATLVGMLAYLPLQYIIYTADFFAALPFAAIVIPEISVVMVVAMYAVLGCLFYWWRNSRPVKSTQGNTVANSLTNWQIVEENELGGESIDSTPSSGTPLFFR